LETCFSRVDVPTQFSSAQRLSSSRRRYYTVSMRVLHREAMLDEVLAHDAHSIEVLFGDGAEEAMSTEEFESIERAFMQLTGPLLRVAIDRETQRELLFLV
jgi:hypothetical protein